MNEPVRICHVLTPSRLSGTELYALNIARKLGGRFTFHVITEPVKEVVDRARQWGLEVSPLRMEGKLNVAGYARLRRLIADTRPSLVHAHHTTGAFFSGLACRRLGIPSVCTLHGHIPFWWQRPCSHFITISRDVHAYYRGRVPAARCTLIPNGVDLGSFRKPSADAKANDRRQLGIPADAFVIVQVSHLSPKKNPCLLLETLASHPPSRKLTCVILGEGALKDRILSLGRCLPSNIDLRVEGFRPDPRPYLRAADLFALFPDREPFGYAFVEAMATGLPVFSWRSGSAVELVEEGQCGFLAVSKSPHEIARTLDEIMADRDELERRGMNAMTHVRRYGEDEFLDRIRDLYDTLAPDKG
jgi:glycosyltransferase involved in cell wall biosynthesis